MYFSWLIKGGWRVESNANELFRKSHCTYFAASLGGLKK